MLAGGLLYGVASFNCERFACNVSFIVVVFSPQHWRADATEGTHCRWLQNSVAAS